MNDLQWFLSRWSAIQDSIDELMNQAKAQSALAAAAKAEEVPVVEEREFTPREAEIVLVGYALQSPELAGCCTEDIETGVWTYHFDDPVHEILWEALSWGVDHESGDECWDARIAAHLEAQGQLAAIGGVAALEAAKADAVEVGPTDTHRQAFGVMIRCADVLRKDYGRRMAELMLGRGQRMRQPRQPIVRESPPESAH